jgi:integrase
VSGLIFTNGKGKPNQHLLRDVQALAKDSGFHTELHKLRKTWATRLALAGTALHKLQKWLGHKSLETTQKYLADIDLNKGQTDKIVEAATFVPRDIKVAEAWNSAPVVEVPKAMAAVQ